MIGASRTAQVGRLSAVMSQLLIRTSSVVDLDTQTDADTSNREFMRASEVDIFTAVCL